MISTISKEVIEENIDLVKSYILKTKFKEVSRIEYRTFDEGVCDAYIFTIAKSSIVDGIDAFTTLYNSALHFFEYWELSDTTKEDADNITDLWMLPEINKYTFKKLSKDDVHKEIDSLIYTIKSVIKDSVRSGKYKQDPNRWGVYLNNKEFSIDTNFSELGVGEVISGISLEQEFNSVEIMFQTDDLYALFSWGTGA